MFNNKFKPGVLPSSVQNRMFIPSPDSGLPYFKDALALIEPKADDNPTNVGSLYSWIYLMIF